MMGCCDLCTRDFKPGDWAYRTAPVGPFVAGFVLCDEMSISGQVPRHAGSYPARPRLAGRREVTLGENEIDLKRVPVADLEYELQRRRRIASEAPERTVIKAHCDQCKRFKAWPSINKKIPDDYNPCTLGHTMKFLVPDVLGTDDWGFYRPGCKDRLSVTPTEIEAGQTPAGEGRG